MLNHNAQVGLKIEATEGTEETLVAADFRGNRKESTHRYTPARYQRGLDRGAMTRPRQLMGSYAGVVGWMEELVGGAADTPAPWHSTIRGMGFGATPLQKNDVTGITNTFRVGELIGDDADQEQATKTARLVDIDVTNGVLYYHPLSGGNFADTETVYGYGGGTQPSATIDGAAAVCGFGFRPLSETDSALPPSLTVERRLGGQRHTIVGARGTGSIAMAADQPLLLSPEFTGVPIFDDPATLTPRLGGLIGPAPFAAPPPITRGIPIRLRNSDQSMYAPVLTELQIQFGNSIAQRRTINDGSLGGNYESGYKSTRIGDREVTANLDPEHILAADGFDFIGALNTGSVFELYAQHGALSGANGRVTVYAPEVQLLGDYEPGDRDGITTSPLSLGLYGDQDDELWIWHTFA